MTRTLDLVALLALCGCWPASAQLDEKPPISQGDHGASGRSSPKGDADKSASGLVNASGVIRQIDEKTVKIESDDHRVITCNLSKSTALAGPSGKITLADLAPGMRVEIKAKTSADGEELNATLVELSNPTSKPNDLKTATTQEGPPDEEGRPILRRGIPPKRKADASSHDEESSEAGVTPPAAPAPAEAGAQHESSHETLSSLTGSDTQQALIEKARQATAEFSGHLPNFVCQQFTTRYKRETRAAGWQAEDVVTATVVYRDGVEDYQNIKVGNHAVAKGMMDIKGQRSTGEFGLSLANLMDPGLHAQFTFVKNSDFKRQKTKIYDVAVSRANSDWTIQVAGQSIRPAYSGKIWVDRESGRVLRLERHADDIPETFPNDLCEESIDYDMVMIGTKKILLPTESENLSCERGTSFCSKNVIEFRNYHEFRGDATLDFDK